MLPLFLSLAFILQTQTSPKTMHAQGTFTVDVHPLTPTPAPGITRFSINKQIHGDLEATTQGEMFAAGDFAKGNAGYVAIEVVTGTLRPNRSNTDIINDIHPHDPTQDKHGTFALQHTATMDSSGPKMTVIVVPGSGTGDFTGITGTITIIITPGRHDYKFDYIIP